ncbi:triose-phosphate isomerase [Kiritimatiella glycovorans]|uniref:Triosephosphate isomerase n=1 Tax=Kiritimatiella glycovorans TaxID=1307763 RepID=A0A0G3EGC0_9BACT|nr:triose-phosphate isomerase [Kiritimatiella glycovorans]AKJ63830.1 Triosephosphate isomerase [Kiritimatiella glycovorans]
MRKMIVAGNWKMNKTVAEAADLVDALKIDLAECQEVEVVVCPPFTALKPVSDRISETQIALGAQNMYWEREGAYTGEVSPAMLKEFYCRYVILGHSERRAYFGETDESVNRKLKAALENNLRPIMCVGETLEQRDADETADVVTRQVRQGLADVDPDDLRRVVIAYEPVWAIGTGRTASAEQAQEVHALIRTLLVEKSNDTVAQSVRIQYGGSVKPNNAAELFACEDIDGGLIGGAALDARSFTDIVKAAM